MKYFLVLLCSNPLFCFSQQFLGFGNIRIGLTEKEFVAKVSQEIGDRLIIITEKNTSRFSDDHTKYVINDNEPQRIYQLKFPENAMILPYNLYVSDVKRLIKYQDSLSIYYLPLYKVGEITIKDISVICYRGNVELIETSNEADLLKAAKEKYPPAISFDTLYKVVCTYVASGVKKEEEVFKTFSKWIYPNSFVESLASIEYNSECKKVLVNSLKFETNGFSDWYYRVVLSEKEKKAADDEKRKQSVKEKI